MNENNVSNENNEKLVKEFTVNSEKIYEGKIINLRVDTVELPNRKYAKREIVEHNGAVAILAIEEDSIILVRQYRKAAEDFLFEVPAGKLEHGEDPIACASRELLEETGYIPKKLEQLCEFYSTPGFSTEKIYLFLAEDLTLNVPSPDEDEFIVVEKVNINYAYEMIKNKEIIDAKTIIAVQFAKSIIANKNDIEE